MKLRAALLAVGLVGLLAGCDTLNAEYDPFGDDSSSTSTTSNASNSSDNGAAQANGCTPQGCPQAPQFCVARGYRPETEGYRRCLISVEQNLRKGTR